MFRRLSAPLLVLVTLLAGLVAGAGEAAAATGWGDSAQSTQTYIVRDNTGTVDTVKIVVAVQYFSATNNTDLTQVSAVRARCSVRALNGAYVIGVRVDDCAVGISGGATLRACDGCPVFDGGGCCANGYSGLRFVEYAPGGLAFLGRGTITYRGASGVYHSANWYGAPSSANWDLI